ncbi:Transposase [Salinivirga cyanobacteriivorans]|uniref:Transposase n=1 Tax=Salinivirga cyanobacteriivorans TaxID=1307839 RepID=A0A0S2I530_9BACT|nr:IS4 family transposase [Salinivirga cyanobacteriivorans]ALO17440.1 Transposase [Salinivirga cyanobacteriivorans]
MGVLSGKQETVGFEKLANAFDSNAKSTSSLRRIQRFIASYALDADLIAKFIFSLLPNKKDLKLSIDRTNWKFGQTDINIFMLGVVYKGVAFPLLFKMLDKRGNSSSQERIDLVNRFIRLFGADCIDSLMADREFVGEEWIKFLNDNQIRYYIRIRNNFKIFIPHKIKEIKAWWLFNNLKMNQFLHYQPIVRMGSQLCYISGCKLKSKNKGSDFLIIVSFNKPEQAQINYKDRWQIETCFKAMKSSGFDIEKTHLQEIDRIERLTLMVMIAFVW